MIEERIFIKVILTGFNFKNDMGSLRENWPNMEFLFKRVRLSSKDQTLKF